MTNLSSEHNLFCQKKSVYRTLSAILFDVQHQAKFRDRNDVFAVTVNISFLVLKSG